MKIKRLVKGFRYGEKGFTLIELLVVVMILGTLAAIVIPNVTRFMGEGDEEAKQTEMANIQTAITALMFADEATALASDYTITDFDTCEAVVTDASPSTGNNLTTFFLGMKTGDELLQTYHVATNGSLTIP